MLINNARETTMVQAMTAAIARKNNILINPILFRFLAWLLGLLDYFAY